MEDIGNPKRMTAETVDQLEIRTRSAAAHMHIRVLNSVARTLNIGDQSFDSLSIFLGIRGRSRRDPNVSRGAKTSLLYGRSNSTER